MKDREKSVASLGPIPLFAHIKGDFMVWRER